MKVRVQMCMDLNCEISEPYMCIGLDAIVFVCFGWVFFIYFWLCWVFLPTCGLYLVAVHGLITVVSFGVDHGLQSVGSVVVQRFSSLRHMESSWTRN